MKINFLVPTIIGLLVLGGLFFVFKPKTTTIEDNPTANTATVTPTISPSTTKTFDLVIAGRKIVSGPQSLTANQGDEITIKITADENEEFHLHAYDNSVELEPGKTAEIKLTATLTGRFPFELEKSKAEIGVLEVLPK